MPAPDKINVPLQESQTAQEGWAHRSLVAFDIFMNVLVLRGRPDETISAHSYRAYLEGKLWGRIMNSFLNIFQANHGAKAAAGDFYRATAIKTTEEKALSEKP